MSPTPILYSFRRCPYAMRARMALQIAGIAVEHREVLLKDKPPQMLELSPKGSVPVLQCADGTVLEESLDIMYWALQCNDPEGWLPENATAKAKLDQQIAEFETEFKPNLDAYKYSPRQATADEDQARLAAREHCAQLLQSLETQLAATPFLYGEAPSLADVALMPFVRQFAHVDLEWFRTLPCPRLQRWLEYWLDSPLFKQVMTKHPQWAAES